MCLAVGAALVFFQAEDGIRNLVRSRGLGDGYKRQVQDGVAAVRAEGAAVGGAAAVAAVVLAVVARLAAVSYTHLTLPTSDLG